MARISKELATKREAFARKLFSEGKKPSEVNQALYDAPEIGGRKMNLKRLYELAKETPVALPVDAPETETDSTPEAAE